MRSDRLGGAWSDRACDDRTGRHRVREFVEECLRTGATYRLRRDRFETHGYAGDDGRVAVRFWQDAVDGCVDVAMRPTLAPAVLEPSVVEQLRFIGPVLVEALRSCVALLRVDGPGRSLVTAGARGESAGMPAATTDPWLGHWIRIDYALRDGGPDGRVPQIFDVNLMPGMTHVTAGIDRAFHRHLLPDALAGRVEEWRRYDTSPLDDVREQAAATHGSDEVWFVVRRGHGLEPDVGQAAKALASRGRVSARVVPLHEVDGTTFHGRHAVVVRQVRAVSKHAVASRAEAESRAIKILTDLVPGTATLLPGFHLFMESHAWPCLIRREPYRRALQRALGDVTYERLCRTFPRTAVIGPTRMIEWSDGTNEPLSAEALSGRVLKSSDSTGAEGVTMFAGSSRNRRRYREEAVSRLMTAPQREAWVVQDIVPAPRERYPVLDPSGRVVPVEGSMRYAAYYAQGRYMGGYALMSPTSRMVHGGSGTWWVPIIEPSE